MKPREAWGCIPVLQVGSEELTENKDKAQAFLEALCPAMSTPDPSPPAASETEFPWHPITELEIGRSLKTAKGTTAPGEDNLPMLIWKKTWGHLKSFIVSIFTACVELGHRFPLAEVLKTMDVNRLNELETIDPHPLPPWRPDAFAKIELEHDRETARERADSARNTSDIVVYSEVSGREGHLGAAIAAPNDNDEVTESQQVHVRSMERWSVHVAVLIGIFYAVSVVFRLAHQRSIVENHMHATATILCDSRSALEATQNVRNRSGQRIILAILQAATEVQAGHISLRLQWMPGHCGNVGNEAADRLAKAAAQWEQGWKSSTKGAHLRKVDGALPARYTRKLYGNLPRNRAYLPTQLRTSHS
ncbi:hypothetical protein VN97_g10631 [Penicillium thymicola]|uniref:RNase H type-1 domain-containing protein n=1 Tax=Penicillium thymicola TaxID=293382 RepID=A0AAI9T8X4_PENTH|nr:hypothetical protein VN97_g10631 [Penicillium thymicola]